MSGYLNCWLSASPTQSSMYCLTQYRYATIMSERVSLAGSCVGLRRYTLVKGCNYPHVVLRWDLAHLLFPVESHVLPNTHFLSPLAPSCALLLQSPEPPVGPIVACTHSCTSMPLHPFSHILQLKCPPFPHPLHLTVLPLVAPCTPPAPLVILTG